MELKEFEKMNSQDMKKAIKIVEEEGIENYTSKLCGSDFTILPRKTGFIRKKRKNISIILSEECAQQIINRSKMNKYLSIMKGEKYPVRFDENKIYAYEIGKGINKINEVYNAKKDDDNFDNLVRELNDELSRIVTFDKKEKVVTVKFTSEDISKIKTILAKVNIALNSVRNEKAKENNEQTLW